MACLAFESCYVFERMNIEGKFIPLHICWCDCQDVDESLGREEKVVELKQADRA